MKKLSKMIGLLLVVVMCFGMIATVNAAEVQSAGGTGTTPVTLTVAAATFSVTVPTALPVTVLADGTVVAPDAVKIINNSAGAVKVENVVIEGQNDWVLVDFGTDLTAFKVDEKKIGLQINSEAEITADDGSFAFDAAEWAVMNATNGADGGSDEYEFTYAAILAPQSNAITDATVANVIFTIGWDDIEMIDNVETVVFYIQKDYEKTERVDATFEEYVDWYSSNEGEYLPEEGMGLSKEEYPGYYEYSLFVSEEIPYRFEEGMTWAQWIGSEYNTTDIEFGAKMELGEVGSNESGYLEVLIDDYEIKGLEGEELYGGYIYGSDGREEKDDVIVAGYIYETSYDGL